MRLKDPFSLKAADMTKRTNKPRKPRDEESSDEVSGESNTGHQAVVFDLPGMEGGRFYFISKLLILVYTKMC